MVSVVNQINGHKVLMVTGAYFPELSGAGLQCRSLTQVLKGTADFIVFTTTAQPTLPESEDIDGIPVFRVPIDPRRFASKLTGLWRFTVLFATHRQRFSIVHLHGFSQKSILFMALAAIFRKAVVIKLTGVDFDDPVAIRRRGRWTYWWYSRAALFVGISPQFRLLYEQAGLPRQRFTMIPNGVDVTRFCPVQVDECEMLRRQYGLPINGPVVLFVGFFSVDKCPDVLFEAWLRATEGLTIQATLFFVGATRSTYHEISSPLVERIRRESTLLEGTNRRVVFLESILDIEQVYKCADVFVLPSVREGLPNALLEAMASGLGCIASRLEGVTDSIIRDGVNGRLVEPANVEELSNVLQMLLAQPDVVADMGSRARKTIEMQFNLRDTGQKYLAAYRLLDSGSL